MNALKIIGCAIGGGCVGFIGGAWYGMQDMTPERMFAPFIGAALGGFAGMVVGSLLFA